MGKTKARVEWHNKLHSLSHRGPITIRLKGGDQAAYKNTELFTPCCWSMRQIGNGSHFHHLCFVLQKKEALLDWLTTINSSLHLQDNSPPGFVFFFFKKVAIFRLGFLTQNTSVIMGSAVTSVRFALHAKFRIKYN